MRACVRVWAGLQTCRCKDRPLPSRSVYANVTPMATAGRPSAKEQEQQLLLGLLSGPGVWSVGGGGQPRARGLQEPVSCPEGPVRKETGRVPLGLSLVLWFLKPCVLGMERALSSWLALARAQVFPVQPGQSLPVSCSGGTQRHRPRRLQLCLRRLGGAHAGHRLQAARQDGL